MTEDRTAQVGAGLVPRWLSVWGMIGAGLALVGSLSVMSGLFAVVTTPYIVINLPLVFQELVFAIWLIARGFTVPGELRPRVRAPGAVPP